MLLKHLTLNEARSFVKRVGKLVVKKQKAPGVAWVPPTPRVFFVRVANKGVRLDAASRASTFGGLNTETQSAQMSETGAGLERRAERAFRVRSLGPNSVQAG